MMKAGQTVKGGKRLTAEWRSLPDYVPHPVKPMLATLVAAPFDRTGWFFEPKWDGFRAIAEVEHGKVRLYSRNQESFQNGFTKIAQSLAEISGQAVLDGELVAVDASGRSSFQLLQNYRRHGQGHLRYCVFDLLAREGKDLRRLPLRERKKLLRQTVRGLRHVQFSPHEELHGRAVFAAAAASGLEGIIAKDSLSTYQEGRRSDAWLKIKAHQSQEALICGYTQPRNSREFFGSLVLGVWDGGELKYIGQSGTGFDRFSLKEVFDLLQPLRQKQCPFVKAPRLAMPVQWVKPRLICQVQFQEWTEAGRMRHPVFLGLRRDKSPQLIRREVPAEVVGIRSVATVNTKGSSQARKRRVRTTRAGS